MALEPVSVDTLFVHSSQFHVPICRQCRHAVWPRHIASHVQGRQHRILRGEARRIQSEVQGWFEVLHYAIDLPPIPQHQAQNPELQIHRDGLLCVISPNACHYICRTTGGMKVHISQRHPGHRGRHGGRRISNNPPLSTESKWRTVSCQRLFIQGRESQYFEVRVPSEPHEPIPDTAPPNIVEQARGELQECQDAIERRERQIIEHGAIDEANPWLKRTGWVSYLEGFDRAQLLTSIGEPLAEDDPVGQVIWEAMGHMIQHCQQAVVQRVGLFVRMEVVRTEKQQNRYQPIQAYMDVKAIREHARPWQQMVMFIVRTQREHEWRSPRYRLRRKQRDKYSRLRDAAVAVVEGRPEQQRIESENSENSRPSTADSTRSRPRIRIQGIQRACLEFCISLLSQKIHRTEYDSPLICALAVLGVKSDGWKNPDDYPPILSAVIKIGRFMVIQTALQAVASRYEDSSHSSDSTRADQPGVIDHVTQLMDRYMIRGSHSPMQWMLDLRTYGMKIHYNTTAPGHVDWIDDVILYKKIQFSMAQFRGMVHGLVERARQVLIEDILTVDPSRPLPSIPWAQLRDDPTEQKRGWSFIHDIRNPWPVDGSQWLFDRLMAQQRDTFIQAHPPSSSETPAEVTWNQDGVRAWLDHIRKFREYLLLVVHITGGQPGRAPEVLSIRHTNTIQGEHRNVFIENGAVVTVTRYHKGYNISGDVKIIHRYLPRPVGELVIYYLCLVVPFQQRMEAKIHHQTRRSYHIWPAQEADGSRWTSPRMRELIKRESEIGMGVILTSQAYRDIVIAISRRYTREQEAFEPDEDDIEGNVDEDHDEVMDLQAGHSTHVAGMVYARGIGEQSGVVETMRQQFRRASETWHQFIGFPSGVEQHKRKRAPFQSEAEEGRVQRWKRLRTCNIQQELQQMMNDEACQFRGIQQPAIDAIMRGDSRVIAIMGTGGGKSLLFMLPVWCAHGGTTVVIVPLIALRQDMMQRCRGFGIECAEWNRRQPPDHARIVFVTPESALSDTFATFINRLKAMQQLDRIVIDECHVVLNDQKNFRPRLRQLGEMNRFETQIVMLTATLPPVMEGEFRRRMGIEHHHAVPMFRMRTTRGNIRYRIHDIGGARRDHERLLSTFIRRQVNRYMPGKVVIYCPSVAQTQSLAEELGCDAYHHDDDRAAHMSQVLERFRASAPLLTATNAFGMGIDIPHIRCIVHVNPTRSLLEYAQESGRAGRDGAASEAIIVRYGATRSTVRGDRAMEQFVTAPCQRAVLDWFMDGHQRVNGRCDEDEQVCHGCRGGEDEDDGEEGETVVEREVDVDRETSDRDEGEEKEEKETAEEDPTGHEEGEAPQEEDPIPVHLLQIQHREQRQIRVDWQRRAQEARVEVERLKEYLERMQGQCPYCTYVGLRSTSHTSIYWCREEGSGEVVELYNAMKRQIRQKDKKVLEDFGGCRYCFVPQAWCRRWQANDDVEVGGWVEVPHRHNRPIRCQFEDMILGGLVTVIIHSEGIRQGMRARIQEQGLDPKQDNDELEFLGRRIVWGGVEAWQILKEFWIGIQAQEST